VRKGRTSGRGARTFPGYRTFFCECVRKVGGAFLRNFVLREERSELRGKTNSTLAIDAGDVRRSNTDAPNMSRCCSAQHQGDVSRERKKGAHSQSPYSCWAKLRRERREKSC